MSYLHTVGLLAKKHNREAAALAETVEIFLREKGVRTIYLDNLEGHAGQLKADSEQLDLLLAFGGDGTMIRAARRFAGGKVALSGINLGRVGFLLELSRSNWQEALLGALEHGFAREERMLISGELVRDGEILKSSAAVNEFVISRGGTARLISMELFVAGKKILHLRADGLIIFTPTGSTAYANSAGGPILHPALNAYGVMAVCPFLSRFQPMVLDAETAFTVKICDTGGNTCLSGDGQAVFRLRRGDSVRIKGIPHSLTFARFGLCDFFDKLRSTGMAGDSFGATINS
jgi:NAD+ kinase